ncbi:MAG: transcription elongation factor GreA [Candidatus Pacebacteria bacterium]|nr:transcription elongation factor GreA [Candidatus Paceibacterota bacterium]
MSDKKRKKQIELTKEGYQELKDEMDQLVSEELPLIVKKIADAREKGDLSENTEYQSAKEEKDIIDARIAEIENVLKRAKVVAKTRSKTTVGIGSTVVVHIQGKSSAKNEFQIVGEYESEPEEGKISSVSPLGKALIGKKEGDEVVVNAPAGEVIYKVDKVS